MKYAYNEVGGLINGVIFFFEPGDEELAREAFGVINRSLQSPTSIVWGGMPLIKNEALGRFRPFGAKTLEEGTIGIRFTVEAEAELLSECLDALEAHGSVLSGLAQEIKSEVLPSANLLN